LTRSKAFQLVASKAFDAIDDSGNGIIDEAELYAGLLLVHLNLAKHAGPAACYPPTRKVCDRLFENADRDQTGGIDRTEFQIIVGLMCAQILSRMLVYYIVLILCVPILATFVVKTANLPPDSKLELVSRETVSVSVFYIVIPLLWNQIDARYSGGDDDDNDNDDDDSGITGDNNSTEDSVLLPTSRREEQRQRRRQKKDKA